MTIDMSIYLVRLRNRIGMPGRPGRRGATVRLAVLACCALAGCTFDVPVAPPEVAPVARPDGASKLPLVAGLYFSDEFQSFHQEAPIYGGHSYDFPIGVASVARWQDFMSRSFASVGLIDSLPGSAGSIEAPARYEIERQEIEEEWAEVQRQISKTCYGQWASVNPDAICIAKENYLRSEAERRDARLRELEHKIADAAEAARHAPGVGSITVVRWLDERQSGTARIQEKWRREREEFNRKCYGQWASVNPPPMCFDKDAYLSSLDKRMQAELSALETESQSEHRLPPSPSEIELIVVPTIDSVAIATPRGAAWIGSYWVEITYGIRVLSLEGEPIESWQVVGRGTNSDGFDLSASHRLPSQAMDAAILDAGAAFMTGMRFQPEMADWLARNTSPSQRQQACDGRSAARVDAAMPATATVHQSGLTAGMELLKVEERQTELIGVPLDSPQVIAARTVIRNDSDRPWLIRREDLRLQTSDGRDVAPIDSRMLIMGTNDAVYFEPLTAPSGTSDVVGGVALGLNLLGIIIASAAASERDELLATLRQREFTDTCLAPGMIASGISYFVLPEGVSLTATGASSTAYDLLDSRSETIRIPLHD